MAKYTRSLLISSFSCLLLIGFALGFVLNSRHLLPEMGCLIRVQTGLPCPFCGMARSIIATFQLDFAKAFLYNPFGVLLLAVLLMDSSLLFLRGLRERLAQWMEQHNTGCAWVVKLSKSLFVFYSLGRMLLVYLERVTF